MGQVILGPVWEKAAPIDDTCDVMNVTANVTEITFANMTISTTESGFVLIMLDSITIKFIKARRLVTIFAVKNVFILFPVMCILERSMNRRSRYEDSSAFLPSSSPSLALLSPC